MKSLSAFFTVALLCSAACSESNLPTETRLTPQPRLEFGVQEGSCPSPFTLSGPKDIWLSEEEAARDEADRNGDGYACYLTTHATETEVFRTWTDNNVPLSQIGGCPNGFFLISKFETSGHDSDVNGDGFVCIRLSGNGSTIVIDNNHRT